jgi:predicted TIM-barrel fold metal-dependent hydrolase
MVSARELLGYEPIDIHTHLDHGVPGDSAEASPGDRGKKHICTPEHLKKGYDRVGIRCGAFSTFASLLRTDRIEEENRYLFELARTEDWIFQWVVVHPDREETFRQAEEMLRSPKTLGIKIHPAYHGYDITARGDEIFSFAAGLGASVLMHPDALDKMAGFADRYPDMTLILAHLGGEEFLDAAAAARHGNILVDTSGGASSLNNVVERGVERIGAERILFGTDTYAAGFQTGRIVWAGIPDGDKRKILRDNARARFPRAFAAV